MTEKHDTLDLVVVDHFSFAPGMAAAAGSIPPRTGQAVGA